MSTNGAVRWGFITCAVIGALILIAAIVIEVVGVVRATHYDLPHKVYLIGMLFGFVGFFGLDHRRAIEGTTFIVDIAGRVVPFLRAGRRKTDVIVPVTTAEHDVAKLTSDTSTTAAPKRESNG